MVTLSEAVVRQILDHYPARTNDALRDRFGISYNTLLKIDREPIRRSLADRLQARLLADLASSGAL